MKHNIFLPNGWDKWKLGRAIKYRFSLDLINSSRFLHSTAQQFSDAKTALDEYIKSKVCPVAHAIETINDTTCELRVISGIVVMYDPGLDEHVLFDQIAEWVAKNMNWNNQAQIRRWIAYNIDGHDDPMGFRKKCQIIDLTSPK